MIDIAHLGDSLHSKQYIQLHSYDGKKWETSYNANRLNEVGNANDANITGVLLSTR